MLFGIETHFYERNPRFSDMGALKMSARSERRSQKGERERERRSEKKLRARARAALGKTDGERERERRSKNLGASNTLLKWH